MTIKYRVYANDGAGGPIDYASPIGETAATSLATSAADSPFVIGSSARWCFGVRAYDDVSGHEERNVDARAELTTGGSGEDVTAQPSPPSLLRAIAGPSGSVFIHWVCPPPLPGRSPTEFRVYHGAVGGGAVSYSAAVAEVPYATGVMHYSATLYDYQSGLYRFGVRAASSVGEEANTDYVTATVVTSGPASVQSLQGVATA